MTLISPISSEPFPTGEPPKAVYSVFAGSSMKLTKIQDGTGAAGHGPRHASPLPCQPQLSTQYPHNGRLRGVPAFGPVVLELPDNAGDAFRGEAKSCGVSLFVANMCRPQVAQERSSPLCVPTNSFRPAFPDLHAGSSKVNQPLHELGFGTRAAQGVPERFPGFMRFPVEALVEEVSGVEPLRVRAEECGKRLAPGGWLSRKLSE